MTEHSRSGTGAANGEAGHCAAIVLDGFADYNARFADITRRARRRFEQRDWRGMQQDVVERIELYDALIAQTIDRLERRLDDRFRSRSLWAGIRDAFSALIEPLIDRELYKTFFNSLTRRCFRTRGVAADIEFIALEIEPTDAITHPVSRHSYAVGDDPASLFRRALEDYPFAVPYAHPQACAQAIAQELATRFADWQPNMITGVELLDTLFYRERRAYIVGRVFGEQRWSPLVLAVVNEAGGLRVDAVITRPDHLALLFGSTRSYFLADLPTVGDTVVFLRTLVPHKSVADIYTLLGRAKQGKTERYRHFYRHLETRPDEVFVHADGIPGMVMEVFTLPSYPVVFKLIRDRFAYPKNMAREQVVAQYRLVQMHDRVGRLLEAQEFRQLRFPQRQFTDQLREDLLTGCSHTVQLDGDDLVISHCYLERRVRPLDLFVRESDPERARAALLDYGKAIKDLARSGLFPGDLLLKNFGVTRNGNVVFYDYDELGLIGDYVFRTVPQSQHDDDELSAEPWYHVGPADVFPEQFPRFLGVARDLREALVAEHGEIFDPAWWRQVQNAHATGEGIDVAPYPASTRVTATAGH